MSNVISSVVLYKLLKASYGAMIHVHLVTLTLQCDGNAKSVILNRFSTVRQTRLEDVLLYIEGTCIILAQRRAWLPQRQFAQRDTHSSRVSHQSVRLHEKGTCLQVTDC